MKKTLIVGSTLMLLVCILPAVAEPIVGLGLALSDPANATSQSAAVQTNRPASNMKVSTGDFQVHQTELSAFRTNKAPLTHVGDLSMFGGSQLTTSDADDVYKSVTGFDSVDRKFDPAKYIR